MRREEIVAFRTIFKTKQVLQPLVIISGVIIE